MKNKKQRKLHEEYKDLNEESLKNIYLSACFHGDLELVNFVLTSPTLKLHAKIHQNSDVGFSHACSEGHLDIIKYLLFSPNLKEHIKINTENDIGFRLACVGEQWKVVEYFILECNIEKSDAINQYLEKQPNKKIENMFTMREQKKPTNENVSYGKIEQLKF